MKVIKTAAGKTQVKMSKSEWKEMGRKAGWMKVASEATCKECGHKCTLEECMSDAGTMKGCPNCGSKQIQK